MCNTTASFPFFSLAVLGIKPRASLGKCTRILGISSYDDVFSFFYATDYGVPLLEVLLLLCT
jgi:uncharacterized paraquat-inducible protein A